MRLAVLPSVTQLDPARQEYSYDIVATIGCLSAAPTHLLRSPLVHSLSADFGIMDTFLLAGKVRRPGAALHPRWQHLQRRVPPSRCLRDGPRAPRPQQLCRARRRRVRRVLAVEAAAGLVPHPSRSTLAVVVIIVVGGG